MRNSLRNCVALTALVAIAPLASFADTVFSDTFAAGSTINGAPAAPTPTATSYQNWTQGQTPALSGPPTIAAGNLHIAARNTASVFSEVMASFSASPVSLSGVGNFVNLTLVFTDTQNVLLAGQNASAQIDIGLYNSGGVLPLTGSRLDAGTAATGGAAAWTGYIGRLFLNGNANVITRPAQAGGLNSSDQDLLFNNAGSGAFNSPTGAQVGSTTATGFTAGLVQGSQYTVDYRITLATPTSLTIVESLYAGGVVAGTPLATWTGTATGGTFLTPNFDGLAFGWRHTGATEPSSMDINSILITAEVPEPSFAAMLLSGLVGMGLFRRWTRSK